MLALLIFSANFSAAETNDVYSIMRASLRPNIASQLANLDEEFKSLHNASVQLGYNSPTDLVFDWLVHISMPGVTNDIAYFNTYKRQMSAAPVGGDFLTNYVSRLSYVPPITKLSLVFDDKTRDSVSRAIPGVDYPGIAPEDDGSSATHIRIALCAPKNHRRFRVLAEVVNAGNGECEFAWIVLAQGGKVALPHWTKKKPTPQSELQEIRHPTRGMTGNRTTRIAVFARRKGGFWGPPSIIEFSPDPFGAKRTYESNRVYSIDYGGFLDIYRYDEKDCILGFDRVLPGWVARTHYSNLGELILSEYSDDRPKVTRKVRYSVEDGKLKYYDVGDDIMHPNAKPEHRDKNW